MNTCNTDTGAHHIHVLAVCMTRSWVQFPIWQNFVSVTFILKNKDKDKALLYISLKKLTLASMLVSPIVITET